MIACADCGAEILKKDACAITLNRKTLRKTLRVCQNCIRLALGLGPRAVSVDDIKREYQKSGGGDR